MTRPTTWKFSKAAIARSIGSELFLITACTVGLALMLATVICDSLTIAVEKKPPTVETVLFDSVVAPPPQVGPDTIARTHWRFKCQTEADYQIIEKQETSNGWFVKVKIKAIKLELAMPIVIYLPKNATPFMKAHEEGHVEICRRVYAAAEPAARLEARRALGTYEGHGQELDEACEQAIRVATLQLTEAYGTQTIDVVENVSAIYDFLQKSPRSPAPAQSVDEAFKRFATGRVRRL